MRVSSSFQEEGRLLMLLETSGPTPSAWRGTIWKSCAHTTEVRV